MTHIITTVYSTLISASCLKSLPGDAVRCVESGDSHLSHSMTIAILVVKEHHIVQREASLLGDGAEVIALAALYSQESIINFKAVLIFNMPDLVYLNGAVHRVLQFDSFIYHELFYALPCPARLVAPRSHGHLHNVRKKEPTERKL